MKRVEVFWRDAFQEFDVKDVDRLPDDYVVRTMGYVVDENDRFLVIAQEILPRDDGYRAVSAIPRSLVLQVKTLSDTNRR